MNTPSILALAFAAGLGAHQSHAAQPFQRAPALIVAAIGDEPGSAAGSGSGASGAPGTVGVQTPIRKASGNPLWGIPLRTLNATRNRPIFSPSRRPPPPAVVSGPQAPPPNPAPRTAEPQRPQLSLIGTVLSSGEDIGIFLDVTTKKVVRLKTGESVGGWVLTAVRGREAILQKSNESILVAFPPPSSGQRAAPAGPLGIRPPQR
jgi:general secretion pathway protein N